MSAASEVLEPHVHWGTREGRQVFIRMGPDEKLEGGTTMLSNRHIRSITVLRVGAPAFDLASDDGALRAFDDTPAEIRAVVDRLAPDPATWSDVRIAGGPRASSRPAARSTGRRGAGSTPLALRAHRPLPRARAAEAGAHRAAVEGALRMGKALKPSAGRR